MSKLRMKAETKNNITGYMFMLPFFALFFVFTIIPVFIALVQSLTTYNMIQPAVFAGITNYKLLLLDDDIFHLALQNTFVFAFITAPLCFFLSFFLSWVINQLKFRTFFALSFYAPSIMSSVAISVVWMYFFSGDRYGLVNNLLMNFGFISTPVQWTQNADYIMTVVILVQIFTSMGTNFLVFLAGLQNVSRELYEAGRIDGIGSRWQELRYITLPQVKPQMLFGAINGIVAAFAVFDIAVSIAGLPSPNYAGHTIVAHLYDYAFIRFQMGYASSVAVILFLITFVLGKVVMRVLRTND